jgi:hypothetical protein
METTIPDYSTGSFQLANSSWLRARSGFANNAMRRHQAVECAVLSALFGAAPFEPPSTPGAAPLHAKSAEDILLRQSSGGPVGHYSFL